MNRKQLLFAVCAALLILGSGTADAGQTINEAGVLACVTDKWDEKEVEKGHKLVDADVRCVDIPNDPSALKYSQECKGKYEYAGCQLEGRRDMHRHLQKRRHEIRSLGGGFRSQGIHLQDHRRHR